MNIVLTGYMASGKTTVGKALAKKLGMAFVDTDLMVEEKAGMKISEIFEKYGEAHFRSLEKDAVKEASKMDGVIIATGGGVVLDNENVSNLRQNGSVINLFPEDDVVYTRLKNDLTRPLATARSTDEILGRFEARKKYYNNCDFQVKITLKTQVTDTVNKILEFLGDRI